MRILGIDPGLGTIGWGIIARLETTQELAAAGIITTVSSISIGQRLIIIQRELNQLIQTYQPTEVAIEKLYFAKNITTAMSVSEARGVILMTLATHQLPVYEYSPPEVKQSITGYGNASKRQVTDMLRHHLPGSNVPRQDDAADAIAIALTHLTSLAVGRARHVPTETLNR